MLGKIGSWIKRHPVWTILIVLAPLILLRSTLWPSPREYEYITETVERGDVLRKVSASGKLRALNTIKVGSEVSGQVTKVFVDFNTPVKAGQVLAEIDPTRVRARVEQSEAQVAVARANRLQTDANVARAASELQIQERDFSRQKALADRGFVSKTGLDIAQSKLNTARNAVRVAQAQIQSGNAQIAQGNAELASAKLDLRRTVIVAPASGVIINKLVEPGTTVAASFQTPNLFEIAADITKMQVEASVDEADIGQVKEGQDVSFTVDSYPDDVFKAKVRQVRKAPTETQNVVSYLVIIDVDNLEDKLLPGMTANVDIITGAQPNVVRVPTVALRFKPKVADLVQNKNPTKPDDKKQSGDDGKPAPPQPQTLYVAGVDPYKPTKRKVTIGVEGDEYTEITSGLKPGERILLRTKSLKPKTPTESDSADEDDKSAS
jgi:HlyD family secretion protein